MSRYRIFIFSYAVSILAVFVVIISYFMGFLSLMKQSVSHDAANISPGHFLHTLFSPLFLVAFVVMIVCSLLYRILGIVFVADNKRMESGEKALWIVGFALMGFVTAIVFMALASSRNLSNAPVDDGNLIKY